MLFTREAEWVASQGVPDEFRKMLIPAALGETLVYIRTKVGWRIAGLIGQQSDEVVTCNE